MFFPVSKLAEELLFSGFIARLVAVVHGVVVLQKGGGKVRRRDFSKVCSQGAARRHGVSVSEAGAPEGGEVIWGGRKDAEGVDGFTRFKVRAAKEKS